MQMIRDQIRQSIANAIVGAQDAGRLPAVDLPEIEVTRPKQQRGVEKMKKSLLALLLILTLIWPAGLSAESAGACIKKHDVYQVSAKPVPMTLADCYRLSLKQSEIIAAEYQKIIETEGRFLQALSIMMPYASFVSTDTQEEPQKGGAPPSTTGLLTSSSMNPSKDSVRYFHLKQTLFSGFKAFSAMKGAKCEKTQRINERIRAEQLLLVDVSNAFYLLQEKRQDIIALKGIERALLGRIKELREREQLGRSRASEVVNAKTSLYAVKAELQVAASQEIVTRQVLEFLTGVPVGELLCTEDSCLPEEVKPESYYLYKSLTRSDVIAACNEWQVEWAS